jgi:hypothetical protein
VGKGILSLAFVLVLSIAAPGWAGQNVVLAQHGVQERIILMRHAEKPDDKYDPNLTAQGTLRSREMVQFIFDHYGKPDYIFAAANSHKSMRPSETAMPLSNAAGVPIDNTFKDDDFPALAKALLNDPRFLGKTIVVIWHHGNIPEFANVLGAKDGTYPPRWSGHVFNQFLQLDYVGKDRPVVTIQTEPF